MSKTEWAEGIWHHELKLFRSLPTLWKHCMTGRMFLWVVRFYYIVRLDGIVVSLYFKSPCKKPTEYLKCFMSPYFLVFLDVVPSPSYLTPSFSSKIFPVCQTFVFCWAFIHGSAVRHRLIRRDQMMAVTAF